MLVASGVPVLKAMAMCRELLLSQDRGRLDRALASASSGAPLASALHDNELIDTLGLRVLRVSEQTGQIHAALDRLADIHDQEVERALERAGRLIEPILMLQAARRWTIRPTRPNGSATWACPWPNWWLAGQKRPMSR